MPAGDEAIPARSGVVVETHGTLAEIRSQWLDLELDAVCTVFQTYRWLEAWCTTIGEKQPISIAIVSGHTAYGKPLFILPLAIETRGRTRILKWLGGEHANYQGGLYHPAWLASAPAENFPDLWAEIVALLPPFDLVHFSDQPEQWDGYRNPFLQLPHRQSANCSHVLRLTSDFAALYENKRSSTTRRSARKRDKRLEREGQIRFVRAVTREEVERTLTALFSQKVPHMRAIGVGDIYGPDFPLFLMSLAMPVQGQPSPLDLRYLACGEEILATVVGAVSRGRYYGLLLSMTDGPLRRHSPGEMALRHTIAACCEMGLADFDLSQGDAAYKAAWTDERLGQFDTVIGYTFTGRAYAAATGVALYLKRRVKKSPRLFAMATALRKSLRGDRSADGAGTAEE